jgi:DNA ligase-associated metallophosphoesterase
MPSARPPSSTVHWAGETLELRPERAVYLPAHATLLVADVHIGKARTFRRLGVPVPHGTTQDTLARLGQVVAATRAERLVVLGDLLHSEHAQDSPAMEALARWRASHGALAVGLVRGNHDDRAGDPPASLGIGIVDEPTAFGGLLLCHDPRLRLPVAHRRALADAGRAVARVGGHLHPCVTVSGRSFDSLRLPCFHLGPDFLVLPAFGAFTGMHAIRRQPGDRAWAIVEDRVVEVP